MRGMAVSLALAVATTSALADDAVRTGPAAFGDWRSDAPGVQRLITPADLPPPYATESVANPSSRSSRPPGALPKAPPGFSVSLYASGLSAPRVIRTAPNGDLFVAESGARRVLVFRGDGTGLASVEPHVFAANLPRVYGIAFYPPGPDPRWVYVATEGAVRRFPYRNGDLAASGSPEVVIPNLPAGGAHWTRDLAVSSDGKTLFVSVGSATNDAQGFPPPDRAEIAAAPIGASFGEERNRADVLAFDPDGRNERVYATGLRNCSGLTVEPVSGNLWCVVNERDGLGDDLPPDYAARIENGAFFGWPWSYIGPHQDPRHEGERADLADRAKLPDVLFQPHSAPLGITFYRGNLFPSDYRGDAFVAFHGSWNRAKRTGYKVVRLTMKEGRPTGAYEDFLVGFVSGDSDVWGRPVGVAVAADGALLVTDDEGGAIWRVRWTGT